MTEATDTWSAARQPRPRQGARTPATKPADEADRIDNIVVKICGIEEQYREIVVQIEADIAAVVNHDSHFACWPAPDEAVILGIDDRHRERHGRSTEPIRSIDRR